MCVDTQEHTCGDYVYDCIDPSASCVDDDDGVDDDSVEILPIKYPTSPIESSKGSSNGDIAGSVPVPATTMLGVVAACAFLEL